PELAEHALPPFGRAVGVGRRQPGLPERPVADHVAHIEPVAVEVELDQPALAAMQAQDAAELGPAELARGIGQAELAVADGGIRHERKVARGSLSGHVAVANRPASERLELRSCDLDRTGEDRAELALSQLS